MSIMRFYYLFWLRDWGRCVQPLALEIGGKKGYFGRMEASKQQGHVVVFLCEIPY
jgi:hypothetical protein